MSTARAAKPLGSVPSPELSNAGSLSFRMNQNINSAAPTANREGTGSNYGSRRAGNQNRSIPRRNGVHLGDVANEGRSQGVLGFAGRSVCCILTTGLTRSPGEADPPPRHPRL